MAEEEKASGIVIGDGENAVDAAEAAFADPDADEGFGDPADAPPAESTEKDISEIPEGVIAAHERAASPPTGMEIEQGSLERAGVKGMKYDVPPDIPNLSKARKGGRGDPAAQTAETLHTMLAGLEITLLPLRKGVVGERIYRIQSIGQPR